MDEPPDATRATRHPNVVRVGLLLVLGPAAGVFFGFGLGDIITLLPTIDQCAPCDQIPVGMLILFGSGLLLWAWTSTFLRLGVAATALAVTAWVAFQPPAGLVAASIGEGPLQVLDTVEVASCQELATPLADAARHADPAWSRDGTRLAYVRDTDGVWGVHEADVEPFLSSGSRVVGSRPYGITGSGNERSPTWSPDGALAYIRTAQQHDRARRGTLVVLWPDGTSSELKGEQHDLRPHWSPDGDRIAFARQDRKTGLTSLHLVEIRDGALGQAVPLLDGTDVTAELATDAPVNVNHPRWSPDGRRVLFVFHREDGAGSTGLGHAQVDIDSTRVRVTDLEITRRPSDIREGDASYVYGGPTEPTWSADGRSVVYSASVETTSDAEHGVDSDQQLFVAEVNGGTLRNTRPLVSWDAEGPAACPGFGSMDWSPAPTAEGRIRRVFLPY